MTNLKFTFVISLLVISVFLVESFSITPKLITNQRICGTLKNPNLRYPNYDSLRENFEVEPWSVVIFNRKAESNPWEFIGEGVLITNSCVVVSSEIFISQSTKSREVKLGRFENYLAVVGTNSTELPSNYEDNLLIASSEVNFIQIHKNSTQQFSLALLHLRIPLDYPQYVREICLPNDKEEFKILPHTEIEMGGFKIEHLKNIPFFRHLFRLTRNSSSTKARMYSHLFVQDKSLCQKRWNIFNPRDPFPEEVNCAVPQNNKFDLQQARPCNRGSAVSIRLGPATSSQDFLVGVFVKHFEVIQSTSTNCTKESTYFFIHLETYLSWIYQNIHCGHQRLACNSTPEKCIDFIKLCDGMADCKNGEDEESTFCNNINHCNSNQFQCGPFGKCIEKSQACDGQIDCLDGEEDEDPQICVGKISKSNHYAIAEKSSWNDK